VNRECDEAKQSRAPTSTMMAFVFLFAPSRFPRLSSCTRRIKTLFPTWRRWPSSTRCLLAARVASMVCRCEERERERKRGNGRREEREREAQSRGSEKENDGCERSSGRKTMLFSLFASQRIRARERFVPLLRALAFARMKKRKQQHEQQLAANGTYHGSGGSQKRKGNGFVGGGADTAAGVGNGTSTSTTSLLPAPSPSRLARFQSERASLPIWMARKQLLAEVN
jgi:hypothetical protein